MERLRQSGMEPGRVHYRRRRVLVWHTHCRRQRQGPRAGADRQVARRFLSGGPMLELIEGLPKNVVGIVATGGVTMQDCQEVLVPAIKSSRRRHDKIRLYYELKSRFPGSAWDDLDLGMEHASCCERVAIV